MKREQRAAVPFPAGEQVFRRMFTRLGCRGRPPHFQVEFFPYANLTSNIRLEDERAVVRLSDLFRGAPVDVMEALAGTLLAKVYRRRLPRQCEDAYRSFTLDAATRRRLRRVRSARGRKLPDAPRGRTFRLDTLFSRLNRDYFGNRLRRPRLAWSARPWKSQLGIFDPALGQIVLSSRLDRRDVPRSVVEYVLYHEMLHVKHPVRRAACGLQSHSPEFQREERRFRHYARARQFLRQRL